MPAPSYTIVTGSVLEVRAVTSLAGQTMMNVFHYYAQAVTGSPLGTAVVDELDTVFQSGEPVGLLNQLLDCMSNDVAAQHVRYQWIDVGAFRYAYIQKPFTAFTGSVASPALPPNLAASVTFQTELAIARSTGRKQIGGVPAADVVDGILEPAHVARLENFGATATEDVVLPTTGVTLRPFIFKRSSTATKPVITGYVVQTTVRDQRTRTVGQGI